VLTDYKTGKPISDGSRADTRDRHLAEAVAGGRALQAAAYAHADGLDAARGRYFFLKPDLAEDATVFEVDSADTGLRDAFASATGTLLDVWEAGTFLPRLVKGPDGGDPGACRWCRVKPACEQGDTGMRARLRAFAGRETPPTDALERTLGSLLADLAPRDR